MTITVTDGFPEADKGTAAALFWAAFSGKLGKVLGPEDKALAFIADVIDPNFAISARNEDGTLLGIAGYKTRDGALVGGTMRDMTRHYGWVGGLWRGLVASILEREPEPGEFCMDGIFVSPDARGQGVGTRLLSAITEKAIGRGYKTVRLDVIDTNPRAKALYDRFGFEVTETSHLGPLRHVFGFSSSDRMELRLADQS